MKVGPIEAVRVFTTALADARRFYAGTLDLNRDGRYLRDGHV